ncbi:MAG TPA: hypothetical protein VGE11_04210 [Pseudonocardia sp.]
MAERVAGTQQVGDAATIENLYGALPDDVEVLQDRPVRGHDLGVHRDVLDFDLPGEPFEVFGVQRVVGRLGTEEVDVLAHAPSDP